MKTSEVFKKTFGSLSDTVREVRNQHFPLVCQFKPPSLCCQCLSASVKAPVNVGKKYIPPGFWSRFQSVVLCCCGRRGSRRSVARTSGGRSGKVLRGRRRRPSTLRNLSPKKERSSARPARSGQSRRSGESKVSIPRRFGAVV